MAVPPADRRDDRAPAPAVPAPSREVLRALVDGLHEGIVVLDLDGRVRSCNPAAAAVLGRRVEDILGGPFHALVGAQHDDGTPMDEYDRPSVRARVDGDTVTNALVRVPGADGATRWVQVNTRRVHLDGDDAPPSVVLSFLDVTHLRAPLKQARDAEARFRKMVARSSDMFVVTDERGVLTYVSPAVTAMLGYREDEKLGTNVFELLHPDDVSVAIERFTVIADHRDEPRPLEVRLAHADGGWRQFEVLASNLIDDDDVHGIVINARDVSERHRVEAALDEMQQRFRAAFERAPLAVSFISVDGTFLQVNGAYTEMTGYADAELVGTDATRVVHPDDRDVVVSHGIDWATGVTRVSGQELRMVGADGRVIWVIADSSLVTDDAGAPLYVIGVMTDITERKALEERLAHDARHDPLTGLMNRACFLERLDQALARARRDPSSVAVLFLDLDRFKLVNDTLGHDAGDELLVEVSRRLHASVRAADTVARFGGDEFVVLCEAVDGRDGLGAIARRIRMAVERPLVVREKTVYVGASIGIAIADSGQSAMDVIRNSDVAVYRAKERGRSRAELFDEQMRAEDDLRLRTEVELRRAIERDEIRTWYQPIVDVRTRAIAGFEALARWEHPSRGMLTPAAFIDVAEETGLVNQLGLRVFETACRQLVAWRDDASLPDDVRMSVNLSPRQLAHPELVPSLRAILTKTGADPRNLSLEVTETCVMEDLDSALGVLGELRALGVSLSIDDFGTGQSSLNYLRRLPIDVVKIDQSFVFELGVDMVGSTIVAAVIGLAHALGLTVVAEGVENREHLAALVNLDCDLAQGWYFTPALDAARATRALHDGVDALHAESA